MKKKRGLKQIIYIIGICLILIIFSFVLAIRIWIGHDIKKNINIAKGIYPGTAEDALISYLLDTNNSPVERSGVAIWTLGQIRSKKALPVLYELYKNDPEGKTCYRRHNSVLCQSEIHNAIKAIENNYWWVSHRGLNK